MTFFNDQTATDLLAKTGFRHALSLLRVLWLSVFFFAADADAACPALSNSVVPLTRFNSTGNATVYTESTSTATAVVQGALVYDMTANTIKFCDGSNWNTFYSDATPPAAFSFSDQTGVAAAATITSNAVTLTGFPGSLTAMCNNCTAIARNGAWGGTSMTGFTAGDTIAIRQTSSANAGTVATATVSVGTRTSGTWTVTTASDSPAAFAFTDQTGVDTARTITSNAITLAGFSSTLTATCINCTGIARNGVWGASPYSGFVAGNTIAIRQTSSSSYQTTTSATVTLGTTTSSSWSVTTGSQTAAATACGGVSVGGTCPDGTKFAGLSPDGNVPMYTTPCDFGQTWSGSACTGSRTAQNWNNGTVYYEATGYTSVITGQANTAGLVALTTTDSPYRAAGVCDALDANGHTDWYLPARDELYVLYQNKTALGNFLTDGSWYWSSSEYNTTSPWHERFSDGTQNLYGKLNNFYVRCVRR